MEDVERQAACNMKFVRHGSAAGTICCCPCGEPYPVWPEHTHTCFFGNKCPLIAKRCNIHSYIILEEGNICRECDAIFRTFYSPSTNNDPCINGCRCN